MPSASKIFLAGVLNSEGRFLPLFSPCGGVAPGAPQGGLGVSNMLLYGGYDNAND
jgi:hypothetical protein